MQNVRAAGAAVVTLIVAGITVWWLVVAAQRIGVKAVVENGSVVLDEWARAKDVLTIVLPLFSAALAYWVGSQGTTDAKKDAEGAKARLEAVLDSSPVGVLDTAKKNHPDAFPQ